MNTTHHRFGWPLRWLCACGSRYDTNRHLRTVDLASREITQWPYGANGAR